MTTYKVAELDGALLDAAVAKAEGVILVWEDFGRLDYSAVNELDGRYYKPSTDWRVGGRIIERERISVIAALRAYVASKYGDTIELP